MPRKLKNMLIAAALIMLSLVVIVAAQVDNWSRDLTTNRAETSIKASDPRLHSLELLAPPDKVREAILSFVEQSSTWRFNELAQEKNTLAKLHLERTSTLFRFVDDVLVFLKPTDSGTLVDATSQSRIGKGDFGQNPRNIHALMQTLRKEFQTEETNQQD